MKVVVMMRLLIHDLETKDFQKLFPDMSSDMMVISDNGTIHHCIGCFGCWVKTPAACVIRDEYGDMGELLSKCSEVIVISKCCYGGFSPFVKNVLDRSISYIHPYFEIRNGEMHHRRRYNNKINLKVWFYGKNITETEKITAERLVKANAVNLDCSTSKVAFIGSIKEMEQLAECNVLVFAFPIYVDGIPSHLLNCLMQLESFFSAKEEKDIIVYSIANCGFYEGHQAAIAIEMMKNWCIKAGLCWGQGVGVGAGGMLTSIKNVPIGYGPKKSLGAAFEKLAKNILEHSSGEDIFITADFPRTLYKLAAEMGWRKSIKANGMKKKDLSLKK